MNTIEAMIRKYQIVLRPGDEIYVRNVKTEAQKQALIAAKPRIVAELIRRKEEREEQEAADRAHLQAIRNNEVKICVRWQEGSPLSAWAPATEQDRIVLKELKLARDIGGWGTSVDTQLIKAVGEEFYLSDVQEFLKPKTETKARKESEKKEAEKLAFAEAEKTGKPQVLRTWNEPCNDPAEECDVDILREYALPTGKTMTTRSHTW